MKANNLYLLIAAVLNASVALIHLGIVIGGPTWYRFFGAGEEMAKMAASGNPQATITTLFLVFVFAVWSIYALSASAVIRKLPLTKTVIFTIACIYTMRGLMGLPVVLLIDHPYLNELADKLTFMIISSLICLIFGCIHFIGWYKLLKNRALK